MSMKSCTDHQTVTLSDEFCTIFFVTREDSMWGKYILQNYSAVKGIPIKVINWGEIGHLRLTSLLFF